MPFVADCSVTMAWVFPDEATETTGALRESLVSDLAIVSGLWPIEVANVLLTATRHGRIRKTDWPRILRDLEFRISTNSRSHTCFSFSQPTNR